MKKGLNLHFGPDESSKFAMKWRNCCFCAKTSTSSKSFADILPSFYGCATHFDLHQNTSWLVAAVIHSPFVALHLHSVVAALLAISKHIFEFSTQILDFDEKYLNCWSSFELLSWCFGLPGTRRSCQVYQESYLRITPVICLHLVLQLWCLSLDSVRFCFEQILNCYFSYW